MTVAWDHVTGTDVPPPDQPVTGDAARDRLVQGWNGTTSTLDDVRLRGRGKGGPMSC